MPDLCLSFVNPNLFDDVSFHPCIRFRRWESEKVLSFVPPDGNFRLMSYHIGAQNVVNIPIYVRHHISFKESIGGKLEIQIGAKQLMGKNLENIFIEMVMPKSVLNVNLNPNQGKYTFDSVSKLLVWDVGKMELHQGTRPAHHQRLHCAAQRRPVNRLDMFGEKYKPFKGVKYLTKAGNFQVRT
ncbi:AP-3 complex subunit mu-2 [Tyrophagus putrescentiae]|nr:AP-3 complex subunit mu-2 [Tyrophagus putrescentiae]